MSIVNLRHQWKRNLRHGTANNSLESWAEEYRWMIFRLNCNCKFRSVVRPLHADEYL